MATTTKSQSQALIEKTLTKLECDLQTKEMQFVQEYGAKHVDLDIAKHLTMVKSSSSKTANVVTVMDARVKLDQKRARAKANYDLITETEPMKIPSEISNDKSLVHSIKILDDASNKLPVLDDNSSLSRMHRANVLIKSSDDAWSYSLNPTENLILPKKRKDIQTNCRICNSPVQTSTAPTTDFLLCENHQQPLDKFVKTITSIYGSEFDAQPPTDRTQFHLNLYGPVLNRLNTFIQQLKTKASESDKPEIKNIYEIIIDTNIMVKASIILYERYLNPINMQLFFSIILAVLDFAAAHETQIIAGLQASESIGLQILDLCLSLATRLLILIRVILQIFFGFFAIQFNIIYKSILANTIWAIVSQYWISIIAGILVASIIIAVLCGVVYLTYKAYKWLTQPAAVNADIDDEELIIG